MPRAKKKETEAPAGAVTETVQRMPLSELHPFEGHPFKVLDDESMTETVESIRQMGVANPLIVRPGPDGGYEIISGHRRHHAAELLCLPPFFSVFHASPGEKSRKNSLRT